MPSSTVVTTVMSTAIKRLRAMFIFAVLDQPERRDDRVDDLDPDKWHDNAADAINEQISAEKGFRAHRAVRDAPQRQGHQRDDDDRIEDHRGQNGRLRRL